MSKPKKEQNEYIEIYGAREHNLKNIDVKIPRNQLVVITGLSGSGKSSLAFDTIFAEGQRRYIETFSAYARQFLGGLERPDVDKIEGLCHRHRAENDQQKSPLHSRHRYRALRLPEAALCAGFRCLLAHHWQKAGQLHGRADFRSDKNKLQRRKSPAHCSCNPCKKRTLPRTFRADGKERLCPSSD